MGELTFRDSCSCRLRLHSTTLDTFSPRPTLEPWPLLLHSWVSFLEKHMFLHSHLSCSHGLHHSPFTAQRPQSILSLIAFHLFSEFTSLAIPLRVPRPTFPAALPCLAFLLTLTITGGIPKFSLFLVCSLSLSSQSLVRQAAMFIQHLQVAPAWKVDFGHRVDVSEAQKEQMEHLQLCFKHSNPPIKMYLVNTSVHERMSGRTRR